MKTPFLLFAAFILALEGCTTSSQVVLDETPSSLTESCSPPSSRAFQKALSAISTHDEALKEKARIDYLLERISACPYNFIRNGKRHNVQRAVAHLRWKHFRRRSEVKTAEDFIEHIASGSNMSGEPYFIEFLDKKRYPLHLILEKELQAFDRALQDKTIETQPSE